jgi:hypothetical protein
MKISKIATHIARRCGNLYGIFILSALTNAPIALPEAVLANLTGSVVENSYK